MHIILNILLLSKLITTDIFLNFGIFKNRYKAKNSVIETFITVLSNVVWLIYIKLNHPFLIHSRATHQIMDIHLSFLIHI